MIYFNKMVKSAIYIMIAALFGLSSAQAQGVVYVETGYIDALNTNSIVMNDDVFSLSPTVKVFKANGKPGLLLSLSKNDHIEVTLSPEKNNFVIEQIRILE